MLFLACRQLAPRSFGPRCLSSRQSLLPSLPPLCLAAGKWSLVAPTTRRAGHRGAATVASAIPELPEPAAEHGRQRSRRRVGSGRGSTSSRHSDDRNGVREDTAGAHATAPQAELAGSVPAPAGKGRMVIVDASALLYRAHYSTPPGSRLTNALGEDTSVLYRFFRSLFPILEVAPVPSHVAVVMDSGGSTFRHELDAGYKSKREGCPAPVSIAANRLRALLPLMGLGVMKEPGWEADDLIASLAFRAAEAGLHVLVVSPDKDLLQILRPGVELLRLPTAAARSKGKAPAPYTHLDFGQDYGIPPPQYAEVLALAGDAVDSIPGLPGIGEKSAVKLLLQFGSLQRVLQDAEQVKHKTVRAALAAPGAAALAQRCLQLATLRSDLAHLPQAALPLEHWRLGTLPEADAAAAVAEFEALEFKSLSAQLQAHLGRLAAAGTGRAAAAPGS